MKTLLEVWRLLDPSQRRRVAWLCVVALGMALSTVCGVTAVLPFLASLSDALSGSRSGLLGPLYDGLGFESPRAFAAALGLGFVGFVALSNAVNLAGTLAMTRFAFEVGTRFQVTVFDEFLRRDRAFHARQDAGTLASKVVHEAGRVTTGVLHSALMLITGLTTSLLIVAALVVLDPLVALAALATLGTSYLLVYRMTRQRLLGNGRLESRHAADRQRVVGESFSGHREILLLGVRPYFVERFRMACLTLARTHVGTLAISQAPKYLLECVAAATLVGTALLLADRAGGGSAWMAQLAFVGFAAYRLLPALQGIYAASVRLTADSAAFEAIADELRRATARSSHDEPPVDREWVARPRREIVLDSVSFRYTPERPEAVREVSLRIPAGSCVGLVGPNGAGKTTLLDLLTGQLVPQSGRVLVDGLEIDERRRREWRRAIAYVPQDVFLLDATIAENVAFGLPAREIDDVAMCDALRGARLEEFIASLPHGLDERLGERGARLSGGQRQRLGIARALYRDASVLVLDEGTRGLDAVAEADVLATLAALRGRKTVVLVTHREHLLQQCDVVVELAQGRVVDRNIGSVQAATTAAARR